MFRALGASAIYPICNDLLHARILVFWLLTLKLVSQNTDVTLSFCYLLFAKNIIKVFQITRLSLWEVILIRCNYFSVLRLHVVRDNTREVIISLMTGIRIHILALLRCKQIYTITSLLWIRWWGGLHDDSAGLSIFKSETLFCLVYALLLWDEWLRNCNLFFNDVHRLFLCLGIVSYVLEMITEVIALSIFQLHIQLPLRFLLHL